MAVGAMLLAAGCAKDDTVDTNVVGGKTIIGAGISETRTSLGESVDGSRKVYWSNGDRIAVNGTASSALENVAEQSTSAEFVFDGVLSLPYKAVYPASAYTDANTVTLPAVQAKGDDSFGRDAEPMVAYADAGNNLLFRHLCAVVKISLTADADADEIAYVEFKGNGSEQVSGAFSVDYENATITAASTAEDDKTVRANVERALSSDGGTNVYVVVPAGTYENGFTVKVVDTYGHYMEKSTTSAQTLVAGQILAMPSFAFVPTGTITGVEIGSAAELIAFAKAYNNLEYADVDPLLVTLTADITFDEATNAAFEPIGGFQADGVTTNYFNGRFNGNGKTIKNYASASPVFAYCGSNGIIYDLTMDNTCSIAVDKAQTYVGALVGYHKGVLRNCSSSATITIGGFSAAESMTVGGLVGRLIEGTVEECSMNGSIEIPAEFSSAADVNVGGFVGYNSNANGVVRNSTFAGSLNWEGVLVPIETGSTGVTKGWRLCMGGIAGRIAGRVEGCNTTAEAIVNASGNSTYTTAVGGMVGVSNENAAVDHCINNAKVTTKMQRSNSDGLNDASRYEYLGGIVGLNDGNVSNSENTAFVQTRSASKSISVGGVVGYARAAGSVTGCKSSGEITARTSGEKPYGSRFLILGGVIGSVATESIADISNEGPVTASRLESVSGATLAVGGCIGQATANINGAGKILNTGKVSMEIETSSFNWLAEGGVIGYATASVSEVENRGTVEFNQKEIMKNTYMGGIVGMNNNKPITIRSCTNSGEVKRVIDAENSSKNSGNCLGGIVGGIVGVESAVMNCTNTGAIFQGMWNNNVTNAIPTTTAIAGGIVGAATGKGDAARVMISGCNATTGTLYAKRGFIGGIAGYAQYVSINDCRNEMSTASNIAVYTGGIAAYLLSSSIENCVCKATLNSTSGTPYLAGIAGYVDGTSQVSSSKYFGSLVSGVAALVAGGIAADTVSGAVISDCGFGGTINGVEMTELSQACGDADATLENNYIWDGNE